MATVQPGSPGTIDWVRGASQDQINQLPADMWQPGLEDAPDWSSRTDQTKKVYAEAMEQQRRRRQNEKNQGLDRWVTNHTEFNAAFGKTLRVRHGAPLLFYTSRKSELDELRATETSAETTTTSATPENTYAEETRLRKENQEKQLKLISWITKDTDNVTLRVRQGAPLIAFAGDSEHAKMMNVNDDHVTELVTWLKSFDNGISSSHQFGGWNGATFTGYDETIFITNLKQAGKYNEKYTSGDLQQAVYTITKEMNETLPSWERSKRWWTQIFTEDGNKSIINLNLK